MKTQHVPYKGAAQALTDVISGNVELYMSSVPTLIGQIKQGKLRALAVTSAKRVDDLPNVPTINESGYKGFDAVTWFGLLAPAGTPKDVVARLNAEFNKALQQPELQQEAGRRRRRPRRRHAGAVRRADQGRHPPLGQGRQGIGRQGRLTRAARAQAAGARTGIHPLEPRRFT